MEEVCHEYKVNNFIAIDGLEKKHDYQEHKLKIRPYNPIFGTTTTAAPETTEALAELTAEEVLKKEIAATNADSQDIVM